MFSSTSVVQIPKALLWLVQMLLDECHAQGLRLSNSQYQKTAESNSAMKFSTESNTVIVGDFNTLLTPMEKINKETNPDRNE